MKRCKVLLVLAVLLVVVILTGCSNPSGDSSSGGGSNLFTLVVENVSTNRDELITSLTWINYDTYTSQNVRFPGGIPVGGTRSLSLAEGTYEIAIDTNFGSYGEVDDGRPFNRGSTVTLVWNGSDLSRR